MDVSHQEAGYVHLFMYTLVSPPALLYPQFVCLPTRGYAHEHKPLPGEVGVITLVIGLPVY